MENNRLAKIIGFIIIILILSILIFITYKIVKNNQAKIQAKKETITYKKPNIDMQINGDYIEYIKVSKKYIDKGVKAISNNGTNLSKNTYISYFKNNRQVGFIDTKVKGTYLIKYSVMDSNKQESVYRTVIVTK